MVMRQIPAPRAFKVFHVKLEILRQRVVYPRAFEIRVHFKVRRHPVVRSQHIRPRHDGGMAVVPRFRVQDGFLQQFRREDRFFDRLVLVADVHAVSVVIHLAPRRDHLDRIRNAQEQARFKEVRQEIVVQRDRQLVIRDHFHTAQRIRFLGDILVVPQYVLAAVYLPADLLDLRRHHQQQRKRVVPRRDRRSVRIEQVFRKRHIVRAVPYFILYRFHFRHYRRVKHIHALVLVPVHQVVSVDQRAHVDVRSVVTEHLGEEVPLHHRRMTYSQFIRVFNRVFFFL